MDRTYAVAGAVFAFLAVAAGAFGAHALADRLTPKQLSTFEIAARYQMYHALALFVVAWALTRWPDAPSLIWAGRLFIGGIVIFAGTLYGIALGGPGWLGAITPIGGVLFLSGWACIAFAAWRG
ncbi:MAG TPA: DUF423 domain-containing protein [Longimicrobiales bacterium]